MKKQLIMAICLPAALSVTYHAAAQSEDPASQRTSAGLVRQESKPALTDAQFEKFTPKANPVDTKVDYSIWDEALKFFVFRMGQSIREGAPSPEPFTGTRRVYGHDSRFRLEGNRITFSFLDDAIISSLTEYRQDLERTPEIVDITTLAKNEQLAFWINLHNVAIIEQIALAYPVSQPASLKIAGSDLPLDEAKFLTVAGIKMSPKDIRTKIVFQHWSDPRVIYGFFRGDIGGPSIQNEAYNHRNVGELLDKSGRDFVNSLRGTQKSGDALLVSEIYEEAKPYFFPQWPMDIKGHLRSLAEPEVLAIIDKTNGVEASIYERDIADLAKGEHDPNYGFLVVNDRTQGVQIPTAVARLLVERSNKIEKLIRNGGRAGLVTVIPFEDPANPSEPKEVD